MSDAAPRPVDRPRRVIADLLERLRSDGFPGVAATGDVTTTVTGITHDSRQVQPGDLYIARAGEHTHGIAHAAPAVAAGAVAVLTDPAASAAASSADFDCVITVSDPRAAMGPAAAWVYDDPSRAMLVLGITGTNGKTTTAYLADAGLRAAGRRTGLIGTVETRIGDAVIPSQRTTPEATDLQALLAVMRERDVDAVTMEISSHALALGRVGGLRCDVAVFTNLSQDHLDFHGDMESYFAAKAELFTPGYSRRGVICVDDNWGQRLARTAGVPAVTTGAVAGADWQRRDVAVSAAGSRARLVSASGSHDVSTVVAGRVNLSNAALAAVSLVEAGLDWESVTAGIASCPGVPGRMERVEAGQPFVVLVDYAHTPTAVTLLLEQGRELGHGRGRVIAVLGAGGDRDRAKRPLMGSAVAGGADLAVLTNDNPRSESPEAILNQLAAGISDHSRVEVEPDRRRAIRLALNRAQPGDVVIIAGKGHETGQEIGGVIEPFDDRQVALEELQHLHRVGAS